ncbi:Nef-associated protein [Pelomyxa schiedti]|nr:Nef-associated protein [Pelomyxa schiedti]
MELEDATCMPQVPEERTLELTSLEVTLMKAETLRKEERVGRIRAERALKALQETMSSSASSTIACSNATPEQNHEDQPQQDSGDGTCCTTKPLDGTHVAKPVVTGFDAVTFKPIGVVRSVYRRRYGTPRQGLLVDKGRGVVVLDERTAGREALCGLDAYSHCWILFQFHTNTNAHKTSTKLKVHPPRLKGMSMGVFATRSPHRPCNIGLSIAKIESIDGPNLRISGLDIIDGTPVFDIKPYIPADMVADSKPAAWASEDIPIHPVEFTDSALNQLYSEFSSAPSKKPTSPTALSGSDNPPLTPSHLPPYKTMFSNPDELVLFLKNALQFDIRSISNQAKDANTTTVTTPYSVTLDSFQVDFVMDNNTTRITAVSLL